MVGYGWLIELRGRWAGKEILGKGLEEAEAKVRGRRIFREDGIGKMGIGQPGCEKKEDWVSRGVDSGE